MPPSIKQNVASSPPFLWSNEPDTGYESWLKNGPHLLYIVSGNTNAPCIMIGIRLFLFLLYTFCVTFSTMIHFK
jgi:hypothetical protein